MRRLGFPVKETDQGCSLVQLKRHGSLTQHRLRLGQELARELGAMGWSGTAHGWHPVALTIWVSIRQSPVYQTRQGNLIVICETDHLAAECPGHGGRCFVVGQAARTPIVDNLSHLKQILFGFRGPPSN